LHYVVNTDGPIPEQLEEDRFEVFDAATRYAKTLGVGLSKAPDGTSELHLNGKKLPCPAWGTGSEQSAARTLRKVGPVINRARYGRNDVIPATLFGFEEQSEAHLLENAMTLADFSHLAYFEPAYAEQLLRQRGYEAFKWVENTKTDTEAFVAAKGKHVVVCFRGTSSGKDALSDLNFFKTDAFGGSGRVHRGFQRAVDSVWSPLLAAIETLGQDKQLFICGHSLGAALAQLTAHRLVLSGHPVTAVYVFGSPRVGNREFKEAYNALLGAKTFLHINNDDIVAQVPPQMFGFHHLGGPPRIFDSGHNISMPDTDLFESFEAPEVELETMSEEERINVQFQMDSVRAALNATTHFLDTTPDQFEGASYGTEFEGGMMDDHSMHEYIFKFGCAIVDREWAKLAKKD
jgi:triacylglycerol lipase